MGVAHVGGTTRYSQVGHLGGEQRTVVGGPTSLVVCAVGVGHAGANHPMGGSLEGARRFGEASNSSLYVAGAGQMGAVEEMAAIPRVQGNQSNVEAIVVSDEEPATDAQPAANTLHHITDTVCIEDFELLSF